MSKKKGEPSRPPQPPTVDRELQFHLLQLVGIPLMMLIPVLALFGLFGETVNVSGYEARDTGSLEDVDRL